MVDLMRLAPRERHCSRCRSARRGPVWLGSSASADRRGRRRGPRRRRHHTRRRRRRRPAEGVAAGSVRLGPTARRICSRARSRSSDCAFRPCRRRFSACCSEGVATRAWPRPVRCPQRSPPRNRRRQRVARHGIQRVGRGQQLVGGAVRIRRTRRHRRAPDRAAVPARNGPCPPARASRTAATLACSVRASVSARRATISPTERSVSVANTSRRGCAVCAARPGSPT